MEDSQQSSDAYGKENKGTAFLVIALLFTTLALMVVGLRIYIRIWISRAFGWDDGMIIFSLVSPSDPIFPSPYLLATASCGHLHRLQRS